MCVFSLAIALSCCSRGNIRHTDFELIGLEYDQSLDRDKIISLIRNTMQEVVDLTSLGDLWLFSRSFLELENFSHELIVIAIELLESGKFNEEEKFIIVYATLNVDFDIRRHFVRNMAITFRNGKIGENLMLMGGFLPLPGVYRHIENYRDPILREALSVILGTRGISTGMKEIAQLILNGELLQHIRGF